MKLDYKVLWIDDRINERQYQDMVKGLEKYLSEEEFFNVTIIPIEDTDDFEKLLNDEFDLIITDYNLGEKNGDYIIQYTRSKGILTEIFFYSANSQLSLLNGLINNSRVTYHQMTNPNGYRELFSEIRSLVDLTIKKFHHIISMRGMVMAETSEIDVIMEEVLKSLLLEESEEKNKAKKTVKDKYIESSNDALKKFGNINEIKELDILLRKIGAYHRWRAINRNCPDDLKETFKHILEKYNDDIMKVRDVLAHAKYFKEGELEFLQNFDPEANPHTFDSAKCKEIRKNLNIYKDQLLKFQNAVKK